MKRILAVIILVIAINQIFAQVSDDARTYFIRGMTIIEIAKSPADFEKAMTEFETAIRLAPNWAAAYFNLGAVQENLGRYEQAISNFRRYLQILPNAKDAQNVKDLITKAEYKLELRKKSVEQYRKISGVWSASYGNWFDEYQFYTVNNELKMKWYSIPVTSFSFDGETLKAKWNANSTNPSEMELTVKLNSAGLMSGIVKVMSADGTIRMYQIVLSRNLLASSYLWYRGQNSELSASMGAKYTIELKKHGINWHIPKAGVGVDTSKENLDFSLEVRMTFITGDQTNFYGLLWGDLHKNTAPENFYFFGITANGNYAYRKMVNGNWVEILSYRPSTAIHQGNATNTLTVKKKGERLEFYINGNLVDTAPAERYYGFIGFHLNHYMKVEIDYLRIDY